MKMIYPKIFLAISCIVFIAPQALAAATEHAKSTRISVKHTKTKAKPALVITDTAIDEDDLELDTMSALATEYNCELGNKLTMYQNANDENHIGLAWKKRIHRLRRIETTTGANRFENRKYGLLWIGIPSKSILLDTKKGQQLANECKNATQKTAELKVQ